MDAVLSELTNPYTLLRLVFLPFLVAIVVKPEIAVHGRHRRTLEARPRLKTAVLWGERVAAVLAIGAVVVSIAT